MKQHASRIQHQLNTDPSNRNRLTTDPSNTDHKSRDEHMNLPRAKRHGYKNDLYEHLGFF